MESLTFCGISSQYRKLLLRAELRDRAFYLRIFLQLTGLQLLLLASRGFLRLSKQLRFYANGALYFTSSFVHLPALWTARSAFAVLSRDPASE